MRTVLSFCAFLSAAFTASCNEDFSKIFEGRDLSTALITETAECIRQHLSDGIPSLNIPSFNPLNIAKIKPDFANISGIEGDLLLTDLYLNGIPNFYLTDINVAISIITNTIEFVINADEIVLETSYDGTLTIFDLLNVYGNGKIKLEVANVQIPVRVVLGLLNIQDGSLTLSVSDMRNDIKVSTTGLLNDEYMSGLIGNRVEDIVQTIFSQYTEKIDEVLTSTLLSVLDGRGALEVLVAIELIKNTCATNEDEE